MSDLSTVYAKLAGLHKVITSRIEGGVRFFDPRLVMSNFESFISLQGILRQTSPELFSDLPETHLPKINPSKDFDGHGFIETRELIEMRRSLDYIFEVLSNSQVINKDSKDFCVFLSHGRSNEWRKVQRYLETDVQVKTLELSQEVNLGRTILQKLWDESEKCSYAVIVMTGDDVFSDSEAPRARENVIHEIGFFQGKFGLNRICLLHEDGANIPSNIHGLVYLPFPKDLVDSTYAALRREIESSKS